MNCMAIDKSTSYTAAAALRSATATGAAQRSIYHVTLNAGTFLELVTPAAGT